MFIPTLHRLPSGTLKNGKTFSEQKDFLFNGPFMQVDSGFTVTGNSLFMSDEGQLESNAG
jgi:hypothetical protein